MESHETIPLLDHLLSLQDSSSFLTTSTIIALTLFFALLCACIIIGHLLEENRWANESITAVLLGLAAGAVVLLVSKGHSSKILVFSEDLFFLYLLPPIIFNAGFQVKKKQFFKNFTIILLFGIFGTVISFCLISLGVSVLFNKIGVTSLNTKDFLAIGAILSATDTVCTLQVLSQDETPFLYSVVFGEGVVNDATSIVLFNSVQSSKFSTFDVKKAFTLLGTFLYLFSTSTALGIAVGLLSAYIIKTLYFGRHSTDREVALMMIMAYLSYMIAELLNLSGILTIFFCGIVMSHYTWHNVTESSRITTNRKGESDGNSRRCPDHMITKHYTKKTWLLVDRGSYSGIHEIMAGDNLLHAFTTMSFIAETFIFLYVGMDALDIEKWKGSNASVGTFVSVSSTLFSMVLIGRAAFVFPLANIINFIQKREGTKIEFKRQFIMWWAGLMRGAVTIALSYNQFSSSGKSVSSDFNLMITCTITVVLFSTIVFGSVTKPLIEALLLRSRKPQVSEANDVPSLEDLRLLFLEKGEPSDQDNNNRPAPYRSSLSLLIAHPTVTVHYLWRKFDDSFMRPVFGGRGFVPYVPSSPTGAADAPSSPTA